MDLEGQGPVQVSQEQMVQRQCRQPTTTQRFQLEQMLGPVASPGQITLLHSVMVRQAAYQGLVSPSIEAPTHPRRSLPQLET